MRRPSRVARVLWRVTALLQLLVPSVVPTADAQVERDTTDLRAVTHVESSTRQDCPLTHHAGCALCQHLTTPLTKPDRPAPPLAVTRAEPPAAWTCVGRLASQEQRPTLPRAPPSR